MHWSKRLVFLFTLFAFLSNLAFAIPTDAHPYYPKNTSQKAQFDKSKRVESFWFAPEAQEEFEEGELESDADLKTAFAKAHWTFDHFICAPTQNGQFDAQTSKYRPGRVQNWNWSNISLTIFFQVFRI